MTQRPREGRRPLRWPDDPETVTTEEVDFEALAHVLANTCRHGGRCRYYHSVAAHAVIVSEEIEALDGLGVEDRRRLALHALIVDAPSAWLHGEAASPRGAKLAAGVERAVREAAGLDPVLDEDHAELLRLVSRMTAAAERRDLGGGGAAGVAFPPLRRRLSSLDPGRAARRWLDRFRALAGPPDGTAVAGRAATGSNATQEEETDDGERANAPERETDHGAARQAA